MSFIHLFGLAGSVMAFFVGVRAIVRRHVVLLPRGSQKADSEHTYIGKEAVLIGVGWLLAALLFGTMSIRGLLQ